MKTQLVIFRIIGFLLLPIAALFSVLAIVSLFAGLANPKALLSAFLFGSFVIYVFSSLRFLSGSIDTGRPAKPSLRDWIRVNAFVSIAMCVMFLIDISNLFLASDESLKEIGRQYLATVPNVPPMLNVALIVKVLKLTAWFMGGLSILLLVHIFLNFRLLKRYRHLFQSPADGI